VALMVRSTFGLAAALALPPVALAASPMQPGLWESTVTIARAGQVPVETTERDCITQKEIDDGTKSLPRPGDNCRLANLTTDNATTRYDFACADGKRTLSGSAEFRIEPASYEGKLNLLTRTGAAQEIASTMIWSARRVGECR
jgi:hypothetical protein